MAERLELGQAIKIDELLQNEPDVTERGNVASPWAQGKPGQAEKPGPSMSGPASRGPDAPVLPRYAGEAQRS